MSTVKKKKVEVKKTEPVKFAKTNIRMTEKELKSVKKATLDFQVGYRDILLLGLKTLKSSKQCKEISSISQR